MISSSAGREVSSCLDGVVMDFAGLVVVTCTVVGPAVVDATGGVVMVTVTIDVANFVALTTVHIRVSYRFPDDVALAMVLDGGTVTCRLSWWSLSRLAGTARARLPRGRPRAWGMLASKMETRNWVENCILKECCTCSGIRDDEKERVSDGSPPGRGPGGFMWSSQHLQRGVGRGVTRMKHADWNVHTYIGWRHWKTRPSPQTRRPGISETFISPPTGRVSGKWPEPFAVEELNSTEGGPMPRHHTLRPNILGIFSSFSSSQPPRNPHPKLTPQPKHPALTLHRPLRLHHSKVKPPCQLSNRLPHLHTG